MSYRSKLTLGSGRDAREIVLTYLTFKDYQKTLAVFDQNPKLVRAGAFPKRDDDSSDTSGCFIWFNFFWIRASYAATLEEPKLTENRFYYESWNSKDIIERGDSYKSLTYSLYSRDHTGYTIHEASELLKKLNRLYKRLRPFSAWYLKAKLKH